MTADPKSMSLTRKEASTTWTGGESQQRRKGRKERRKHTNDVLILEVAVADAHLAKSVDDLDDLSEDVLGCRLIEAAVLLDALEQVARAPSLHRRRTRRAERTGRVGAFGERWGESGRGRRSDGLRAVENTRKVRWELGLHRSGGEEGKVGGSGARHGSVVLVRVLPGCTVVLHDLKEIRKDSQQRRRRTKRGEKTYEVEVSLVLEEVDVPDDAFVPDAPQHKRFHRYEFRSGSLRQPRRLSPTPRLDPSVSRDLRALDELDGDGETVVVSFGADDEPEPAGTEFFAEGEGRGEERVEVVVLEGATGDGGRLGGGGSGGCRGVEKVDSGKEGGVFLVRRRERRCQRHGRRLETLPLPLVRRKTGRRWEWKRCESAANAGRKRCPRHGRRCEGVLHAVVLRERRCREAIVGRDGRVGKVNGSRRRLVGGGRCRDVGLSEAVLGRGGDGHRNWGGTGEGRVHRGGRVGLVETSLRKPGRRGDEGERLTSGGGEVGVHGRETAQRTTGGQLRRSRRTKVRKMNERDELTRKGESREKVSSGEAVRARSWEGGVEVE
jgi:hypothetical protein